ncbi:hypothetical protein MKEN_00620000 [Mycena kentingensis (nom. inval.)]|nr:hypothetical protein MKEN_00620000 [Mycena kentingensis (nom. inval.)]
MPDPLLPLSVLPDTTIDPLTPEVIQLAQDLLVHKLYFAGSFALLFFDYFLTLADEVELIWKSRKAAIYYIFCVNRYCPMAFCVITLYAYTSPYWSEQFKFPHRVCRNADGVSYSCNRFAIVEWLQTLLIVVPAELVLIFRIFALTNRNKIICLFLSAFILVECVIVLYAMSLPGKNNALPLPHVPIDSFHVCILFSDPAMDTAYLATAIAFDSIVFGITLLCTFNRDCTWGRAPSEQPGSEIQLEPAAAASKLVSDPGPNCDSALSHNSLRDRFRRRLRLHNRRLARSQVPSGPLSRILDTMRWDGTLYFLVILSGNAVWMGLAMYSRPGLKFINAQPSMYLTSIMINRLTLSVRRAARHAEEATMQTDIEWPSCVLSRSQVPATPRARAPAENAAIQVSFASVEERAEGS